MNATLTTGSKQAIRSKDPLATMSSLALALRRRAISHLHHQRPVILSNRLFSVVDNKTTVDKVKEAAGDKRWMYFFAGLIVGANVFTVWQESDAHDSSEERERVKEENRRAWEERERRETGRVS